MRGKYERTEAIRKKQSIAMANFDYTPEYKQSVGKNLSAALKGRKFTEEHKDNIGKANKGKRLGKKASEETRRKQSESHKGEKAYWWRGGVTPLNEVIRASLEYKLWREAVFQRDNYTCVWCGDDEGHNLNADHIKPFAWFPELRFAIDNGRTLCVSCHKKTDTYGKLAYNHKP